MRHFSNRLAARIGGVLPRKLFNRHNLVTVCGWNCFQTDSPSTLLHPETGQETTTV